MTFNIFEHSETSSEEIKSETKKYSIIAFINIQLLARIRRGDLDVWKDVISVKLEASRG